MATIKTPVTAPVTMRTTRVLFKLAGALDYVDHSDAIDEITYTPSQSGGSTFVAVNGATIQDPGQETWAATLNLVQDRDPDGFLRWLLANSGTKAELRAKFASDDTDEGVLTVTLSSAGIGGKASAIATSSVTFAADGKPAFSAPIV